MLVFDPAKFENYQALAERHKSNTQKNRKISQEDWNSYMTKCYPPPEKPKCYPPPEKPKILFVRPKLKLRLHFDGAIFYQYFPFHNTPYDVLKFLVKFTNAYPLLVKSICRQKIVDGYADDVIQLITKYLPPFQLNVKYCLYTKSRSLHNDLQTRLKDAIRYESGNDISNHSNIYFRQLR